MPKYNGCHVIRRERKIDNYAETAYAPDYGAKLRKESEKATQAFARLLEAAGHVQDVQKPRTEEDA
jgi:hypothetical protein